MFGAPMRPSYQKEMGKWKINDLGFGPEAPRFDGVDLLSEISTRREGEKQSETHVAIPGTPRPADEIPQNKVSSLKQAFQNDIDVLLSRASKQVAKEKFKSNKEPQIDPFIVKPFDESSSMPLVVASDVKPQPGKEIAAVLLRRPSWAWEGKYPHLQAKDGKEPRDESYLTKQGSIDSLNSVDSSRVLEGPPPLIRKGSLIKVASQPSTPSTPLPSEKMLIPETLDVTVSTLNASSSSLPPLQLELPKPSLSVSSLTQVLEVEDEEKDCRLHEAAARGDVMLVSQLLQDGVHIDGPDKDGRTPLMYAVHFNRVEVVKLLVSQGCNIDLQGSDGATALHDSGFSSTEAMVVFLLQAGANYTIRDNDGRLAMHWATHNPVTAVFRTLAKRVPGMDLNVVDYAGMTTLMWACFYGNAKVVMKLLKWGANPQIRDMKGKSALHWSVTHSRGVSCTRLLLSYQSSFDVDELGRSPLLCAAEAGSIEGARLILNIREGAIHDCDINGRTALHWASACGHFKMVRFLIHHGCGLAKKDKDGKTSLDYARVNGFNHCCAVLVSNSPPASLLMGPLHEIPSFPDFSTLSDSEAFEQLLTLVHIGGYLMKFTNGGKGSPHARFFWVDRGTGEICWTKHPGDFDKDPKLVSSASIIDVADHASPHVKSRGDYSPFGAHCFCFHITTTDKPLDLIAPHEMAFRLWTSGLRFLLGI